MLQLAQILDRVRPGTATLVIVGEEEFAGVGELEPDGAARAASTAATRPGRGRRLAVDAALCEAGRAVWAALRAARTDAPSRR